MLIIITKCRHTYRHAGISNVREAKKELRWTNARGEARSMAWAFIAEWHLEPVSEPR